jgi:hypothetical protein
MRRLIRSGGLFSERRGPLRPARLAVLVLAALPAAAASQDSDGPPDGLAPLPKPRPGAYRTVANLIEFELPDVPASQVPGLRDGFAEELATGNNFCLKSDLGDEARIRALLEQVAEGDCVSDSLYTNGTAVAATMSCTHGTAGTSEVAVNGRLWPENSDLEVVLRQQLEGLGTVRIRLRARPARIGDC